MSRAFKPDSTRLTAEIKQRLVLKGSKISDMDQLILALIFRFGIILV